MIRRARTFAIASLGALTASVALAAGPVRADDAPAPAAPHVLPATKDDFDFRPGALMQVTDPKDGARYWVFSYQLANKTGKTQRFSPRFELLMGDGTILVGGSGVAPDASRRVQRLAAKPEALDQFQIMGDVLTGEENARDGFVVWPAKGDSKKITLFVTGTSLACERAKDPATGKDVLVRRTWRGSYELDGVADPRTSATAREVANPDLRSGELDHWVMR